MGYKLVDAAHAFVHAHNERARQSGQRGLEPTEVALLTWMASRAKDEDAVPTYTGGWKYSAAALGIPDSESGRKRVQRALDSLIASGAIVRTKPGYTGSVAHHSLNYGKGTRLSLIDGTPTVTTAESGTPMSHSPAESGTPVSESGTPASEMRDSGVPPEERTENDREAARAQPSNLAVMPFTLSAREPDRWDAHLPEPRNSTEAARCRRHPTGTDERCGACRENREAFNDAKRKAERMRKPAPLRHRTVGGRRVCDNQPHQPLADGTCANCEIHADDLADLLIGARA